VSSRRAEELRDQLSALGEELADLATDLLSQALQTREEHERVALSAHEKRVTKARRAVEKAVNELGFADQRSADD
jgi:NTP pyrophosphatase (non-canonical NTP hydrolase)